jgi:hypothetical protein
MTRLATAKTPATVTRTRLADASRRPIRLLLQPANATVNMLGGASMIGPAATALDR